MSRVLVTGGAGFVGSHVAEALVAEGLEVLVLDAFVATAHGAGSAPPASGWELARADIRDRDAVARALRGVDAVSHQAAMVGLGRDMGDLRSFVSHNDLGTATLLEGMHLAGFRGRLVLAGSMVVYGEGAYRCPADGVVRPAPRPVALLREGRFEPGCPRCGRALEPVAVTEDAPIDPRNVYAATKAHQEHLCAAYARATDTPLAVLRYHNVYGPRMPRDTPYAGVASLFRSALAAGRPPEVFEDGRQIRDFVHVTDVARANVLAVLADDPRTDTFNIASGSPHTIGEMAEALASAYGPGAPRPLVTGRFRLGDVRHVFASTDRAERRLGFRAQVGFGSGMRSFARDEMRKSVSAVP